MTDIIARSKGPEFQDQVDSFIELGSVEMGPASSSVWRTDPRRLPIVLSRYKFVSKLLSGRKCVLEIGCADGFFTRVVAQTVGSVHAVDYDPQFIAWAAEHARREKLNVTFSVSDVTTETLSTTFDAAYSLDVIEHIAAANEDAFVANIANNLIDHGTCIIGTPNITAAPHASKMSMQGHINLKSAETLRELMDRHFETVFIFSMNDEVVHTGFSPMAHYLFAIGVGIRGRCR